MADVRLEAAKYSAELAARVRERDSKLPRKQKRSKRWFDLPAGSIFSYTDEPQKTKR
jgi:hypothetical protein